jgi:predicted Zn finger-like uncharacterized protein
MSGTNPTPSTSPAAAVTPASCPFCRSPLIVTTAKVPDDDSYWRCTICGEVWNVSRSETGPHRGRPWR